MRRTHAFGVVLGVVALAVAANPAFPQAGAGTLTCVGIYSETSDGQISYRVGGANWMVITAGTVVPAAAQIRVNVTQDWIELTPSNNPNAVYRLSGSDSGDVVVNVADVLKSGPRTVVLPKPTGGQPDPKFANKLVVVKYNSRDVYRVTGQRGKDIQYGDVLDSAGTVSIIAINTTISLMRADGTVITIVGPLNFSVQRAIAGDQLYKYLNAP